MSVTDEGCCAVEKTAVLVASRSCSLALPHCRRLTVLQTDAVPPLPCPPLPLPAPQAGHHLRQDDGELLGAPARGQGPCGCLGAGTLRLTPWLHQILRTTHLPHPTPPHRCTPPAGAQPHAALPAGAALLFHHSPDWRFAQRPHPLPSVGDVGALLAQPAVAAGRLQPMVERRRCGRACLHQLLLLVLFSICPTH